MINENTPDDEWEWYLGQLFSKLIKNIPQKINKVVELAPGFRYKIAYALKEINFSGDLYLIDSSLDVLNFTKKKYKELLPNANIILINKNFKDVNISNNIDLFVSNHSIDDLIIFEYMNYNNYKYNNINVKKDILSAWQSFINSSNINNILEEIKNEYIIFFKKHKVKYIIMSQYKSNVFLNELNNDIYNIVNKCFCDIKSQIINNNNMDDLLNFYPFGDDIRYKGKDLLLNMQTSKNWIFGIYKEVL